MKTSIKSTRPALVSKTIAMPVMPVEGCEFLLVLGEKCSLGMTWCPPTSTEGFRMGSLESESGRRDDERAHQVVLTKGFWLGRTPVTQDQWRAVMGTNPSHFKGGNRPVEMVSWEESSEFCQKVTQSERDAGRIPEGYEYTLPSEAQWEYACRSGTIYDYRQLLDAMGWYGDNSDSKTHPVGLKQANRWGLHDMLGNVREWCLDCYGDYPAGPSTNPIGPISGLQRVDRGGSWSFVANDCRSAFRVRFQACYSDSDLGFRLALVHQVNQ